MMDAIGKVDMAETIGGVMYNLHIGIHYSLGGNFFLNHGSAVKSNCIDDESL